MAAQKSGRSLPLRRSGALFDTPAHGALQWRLFPLRWLGRPRPRPGPLHHCHMAMNKFTQLTVLLAAWGACTLSSAACQNPAPRAQPFNVPSGHSCPSNYSQSGRICTAH